MSYKYLASPYTHPSLDVMEQRYRCAAHCTQWLLNRGIYVYSPIVHCHELAKMFSLRRDHFFWHSYNRNMLEKANELLILTIPSWEQSAGVQEERTMALLEFNLPITLVTLDVENNYIFENYKDYVA